MEESIHRIRPDNDQGISTLHPLIHQCRFQLQILRQDPKAATYVSQRCDTAASSGERRRTSQHAYAAAGFCTSWWPVPGGIGAWLETSMPQLCVLAEAALHMQATLTLGCIW